MFLEVKTAAINLDEFGFCPSCAHLKWDCTCKTCGGIGFVPKFPTGFRFKAVHRGFELTPEPIRTYFSP